ncbi:MAG TPA: hypothetical protein VIC24_17195 [Gemmatimonadaceae bacterium]|jgi:hypothetical protein
MNRRIAGVAFAFASLGALVAAAPSPSRATPFAVEAFKWPPWLSVEWPVNPYDRANRDALLLVHAAMREGVPTTHDMSGTAEGIVSGQRRSVALHLDATSEPGVFALRRQWPANGDWVLRITLAGSTTALVSLDRTGGIASVDIPMQVGSGSAFPRSVGAHDIDSALAVLASRP